MNKKINLLDCTFRDGGYYNNWEFPRDLINNYFKILNELGIEYIELGFRSLKKNDFKGPCWYTTDSYIESLKIPNKIKIGVMINASEIISYGKNFRKSLSKVFNKQNKCKLKFVRIASHINELSHSSEMCKILKSMGYEVGINLMQVSELEHEKIRNILNLLNKNKPDMFYIADSLGALNADQVKKLITEIKKYWSGNLGIHAHNNQGIALSNSLSAISSGANWVDSTISGMGRGPGNTETEYLIIELQNKKLLEKKKILPILKLSKDHFGKLKEKYKWGMNPFYFLAGKHGIHPTYVQEMLSIKLSDEEVINVINRLSEIGSSKYDVNIVKSVFQKPVKASKGTWSPKKYFKGKELLLLTSGESVLDYKLELESYIIKKKPIVLALNNLVKINPKFIDYYVTCNPIKLISDLEIMKSLKKSVILPESLLNNTYNNKKKKIKIKNFGVGLEIDRFKYFDKYAIIPKLYNVAYALAVATSGKASKILLAGFDGYREKDERNKIVNDIFLKYSESSKKTSIVSVTPSNYNLKKISIYAI
jgi:4-hydroxy 2-oxovalerate aldolase